MPTPCGKGRCPARADVYDHNTTEYRKGCRRTPCTAAHTLGEQRRRAKKAQQAAAKAAPPAVNTDEPTPTVPPAELDLVALVAAELDELNADHPLKRSLGGIALAMAHEVQFLIRAPTRSAAGAAKQLVDVLERLMPTKKGGLEEELERLFAEDDDDEPARAE